MKQVSTQSLVILLLSDYLPGKATSQLKLQIEAITVKKKGLFIKVVLRQSLVKECN